MERTKDGRICDKRVRVPQKLLNQIILESKKINHLTWKQFSKKLDVSSYTIRYDWLKKGNTIPLTTFKNLLNLHPKLEWSIIKNKIQISELYWGQKIGKKSKFEDKVKFPELDNICFAEFYGSLLGDGCIYSNLTGLCISGHSVLDRNYLEYYVSKNIIKLFNIKPKIYYSPQGKIIRCVLYNKKVSKFLIKSGFPKGNKKKNCPKIPDRFFKNKELLKACIRGINDTDGSVYPQTNSKIILDISIHSQSLIQSTLKAFQQLGLPVNYTKNRIYLCGKKPVTSFFEIIGSSNQKHIAKYHYFLKTGTVPLSSEIEKLLKQNKVLRIEKLPYHGPVV